MENKNVTYHPVLIKDLNTFANKVISSASEGDFVPISDQRARAMTNNPIASPDDIAMMVAFLGDEVVGYFGVMPIHLWHDGIVSKVHWFSTWNVSPKARGLGIGSKLMKECLKLNLDFMIVGSKPARKVSEKFGFQEMAPLVITSIDFLSFWRFNPLTIGARALRKISSILGKELDILEFTNDVENWFHSIFGSLIKKLLYPMLIKKLNVDINTLQLMEIDEVGEIPEPNETEIKFLRNADTINWMLKDYWVVEPGESRTENMDFYFSDVRNKFDNVAIQVLSQEKPIGFLTYQISELNGIKTLKIEDVLISKKNFIFAIILKIAKKEQADKIQFCEKYINNQSSGFLQKLLLSNRKRIYQCFPADEKSPLGLNWKNIELDFPDGDMGFS